MLTDISHLMGLGTAKLREDACWVGRIALFESAQGKA